MAVELRTLELSGQTYAVRPARRDDAAALRQFADSIPLHDLLFLQRDIRNDRVIAAWMDQIEHGQIKSMVAFSGDQIVACTALVRDELSWSPHVAEVRVLIHPNARKTGLGRQLASDCIDAAADDGVEKLFVRLTPDQAGALKLFEDMGFRPEALLRDHVRDAHGQTHDIVVFALNFDQVTARQSLYAAGGVQG